MTPDIIQVNDLEKLRAASVVSAGNALNDVLERLLQHVDDMTCTHQSTHRGGTIWTICDDCGAKWADDRGGFKPYRDAPAVAAARAALASQSTPVAPVVEKARDGRITFKCDSGKFSAEPGGFNTGTSIFAPATYKTLLPVAYAMLLEIDRLRAALAQSTPHVPAGEPARTTQVLVREDVAARYRDPRKKPKHRGYCFGVTVTKRKDAGDLIELFVEDDDNWHFISAFDVHWLPELQRVLSLAIPRAPEPAAPVAQPVKMPIPPAPVGALEVVYAEGWNACCDAYFGGKPAPEPLIITVTTPAAPTAAQGLSDAEDAARWRMLPAFFEDYQIDAMNLYRDIDAAILSANSAAQETK